MEARDYFKQKRYTLDNVKADHFIYTDDLLSLVRNDVLRDLIIKEYDLNVNIKLELAYVDYLFKLIKDYTTRFSLLRLNVASNKINTYISSEKPDEASKVHFKIYDAEDEDEVLYADLDVESLYDSVNMFYKDRKLTSYVNYLKTADKSGLLLNNLNSSWLEMYEKSPEKIQKRLYRVLDDGEKQYLKSINTEKYNEYGIGETFVVAMLELSRVSKSNLGGNFKITSIALSESKIDIVVSVNKAKYIEGLGNLYSSISIRNEDQGNTSIGLYSSLELQLGKSFEGRLFLYPEKKFDRIENKFIMTHTVSGQSFISGYRNIGTLLRDYDDFEKDYFMFRENLNPDELRAKIEEKVDNINSPFRGIKKLVDLFKKEKVGHISNLETMLKICGKAEMLDMDFDLKFKLRYIISDVLLYGKNDLH